MVCVNSAYISVCASVWICGFCQGIKVNTSFTTAYFMSKALHIESVQDT